MARPRAADDFIAIRERMEELKRERKQAERNKDQETADAQCWRLDLELRTRVRARKNWQP